MTKGKIQERLKDLLVEACTLFLDMWNGAKTRDEQLKLMNKNIEFYVNHMISNGVTVLECGEKYCPNCGSRMTGEEEVTHEQDFEEAEE